MNPLSLTGFIGAAVKIGLQRMLDRILHSPMTIGGIYLLLIPAFAVVYWFNPQFWIKPLSVVQSAYFSVVTITTLGYGDIAPQTESARILAALEALLGILTIGFFLNSVARYRDDIRDTKRKVILRDHLLAQYHEYREDLVQLCLRAAALGYDIDYELAKKLVDYRSFREYFMGEFKQRWYDVLNGFQSNHDVFEDVLVVSDLFVRQIAYALDNMQVDDKEALATLSRVAQQPFKLKHFAVYSGDPVKYVGNFLVEILAGWSVIRGYLEHDFIEESIRRL